MNGYVKVNMLEEPDKTIAYLKNLIFVHVLQTYGMKSKVL